jgi:hypothetical protein
VSHKYFCEETENTAKFAVSSPRIDRRCRHERRCGAMETLANLAAHYRQRNGCSIVENVISKDLFNILQILIPRPFHSCQSGDEQAEA